MCIDQVLSIKIPTDTILDVPETLADILDDQLQKYIPIPTKNRFIAGRILIGSFLKKINSPLSLKDIQYSEYGKPYFDHSWHFNLTHAGEYVLLAYADKPIGIDVELIRTIQIADFETVLHPEEYLWIQEANTLERFFTIWTKKEALLKAAGVGLINNLDNINVIKDNVIFEGDYYHFQELKPDNNHLGSLCLLG